MTLELNEMDACFADPPLADEDTGPPSTRPSARRIADAAERAGRRVAPLWPLKHFVAVNPFLGLTEARFADAAGRMAQVAGARMTMPRTFYAAAIADGRIADIDLAAARAEADPAADLPHDVAAIKRLALSQEPPARGPLATAADVVSAATDRDWSAFAAERISLWAADAFDEGQAAWQPAGRDGPSYAAWREEALIDRTPEVMGLAGFRRILAALPESADELLVAAVGRLHLRGDALEVYFHRLLMSVAGWAGYARYRVWQSELHGGSDTALEELLAVRLAWEVALLEAHADDRRVVAGWARAKAAFAAGPARDPALALGCLLQAAYEKAWQRALLAGFRPAAPPQAPSRPAVQAAFCIDVRSEVFRRALENASPELQTIGFAGFFGVPIEYVPLGQGRGNAQCPVLLKPQFTIRETVKGTDAATRAALLGTRRARRRAARAWKSFKMAAVASFGFVETMGWTYAGKLGTDAFGLTRPVPHPSGDGLDARTRRRLAPEIAPQETAGRHTGLTLEEKLATAEALLGAMSLREGFARLVMLAGHGSSTVNNPHATSLDCGACGGHTGEANARVAAAILNDPQVRGGLGGRGIAIPDDTVFLAALHDTTTDRVTIFDEDAVPASHAGDLARLKDWLATAGGLARTERAALLNLDRSAPVDRQIFGRSRDWSAVRPEWGLAGCAAFIAAPRERTRGLDLGGRSFLHSYDWRQDEGFRVLELVMTAPMVVASWISLQYYGSSVDNRVFGSGNKVLHNVVGTLGVLEGNGGDLRTGLPLQSVHDGERLIHEPLRLSVVIEAPTEAIDGIISKHEGVRELVDNGWLHLFALSGTTPVIRRYRGRLQWETL